MVDGSTPHCRTPHRTTTPQTFYRPSFLASPCSTLFLRSFPHRFPLPLMPRIASCTIPCNACLRTTSLHAGRWAGPPAGPLPMAVPALSCSPPGAWPHTHRPNRPAPHHGPRELCVSPLCEPVQVNRSQHLVSMSAGALLSSERGGGDRAPPSDRTLVCTASRIRRRGRRCSEDKGSLHPSSAFFTLAPLQGYALQSAFTSTTR